MERFRIKNWKKVKLSSVHLGKCHQAQHLDAGGLLVVRCDSATIGIDTQPDEWQENWRIEADTSGKSYPFLTVQFKNTIYLITSSDSGVTCHIINGNSAPKLLTKLSFGDFFIAENVVLGQFYPDSEMVGVSASTRAQHKFYGINLSEMKIDRLESKFQAGEVFLHRNMWSHRIAGSVYDSLFVRTDFGIDCFYFAQNYDLKKRFSYTAIDKATTCESILFENAQNSSTRIVRTDSKMLSLFDVNLTGMNNSYNGEFSGCFNNEANIIATAGKYAVLGVSGLNLLSPVKLANSVFTNANLPSEIMFSAPIAAVSDLILVQSETGELIQNQIETYTVKNESVKITFDDSVPSNEKPQQNCSTESRRKELNIPPLIEPPHLPWSGTSQLNAHFLSESINEATGSLDFKIPLLDAPVMMGNTLQTILYYSSDAKISKLCGQGWDIYLPQKAIRINRMESIFEENFTYSIDSDNGNIAFHKGQAMFETDENLNTTISYDKKNEIWTVDTPDRTLQYGGANAVQWTLGWPDWPGAGTDTSAMQRIPLTWYLKNSTEKIYGRDFIYNYQQTNKSLSDASPLYTYSTNLVSIEAVGSFRISIKYGEKDKSEYQTFVVPLEEPFTMPPFFENDVYVAGISFQSHIYQQSFEFGYESKGRLRLLTHISQNFSHKVEKLVALTYSNEFDVINSITTNSGAIFDYQFMQSFLPVLLPAEEYEYKIKKVLSSAFSGNYHVFVCYDKTISKVVVDLVENSIGSRIASFDFNTDVEIQMQLNDKSFIVLFKNQSEEVISFFNFDDNGWRLNKTETLDCEGGSKHVRFYGEGVAVVDNQTVTLKKWITKSNTWSTENLDFAREIDLMAISENIIATISKDNVLEVMYQKYGSWSTGLNKNLNYGATTADHKKLLQMFNHADKNEVSLLAALSKLTLQIFSNVLQINFIYIENDHLFCRLQHYIINSSHEIKLKYNAVVASENIVGLEKRIKVERDDKSDEWHVFKHVKKDNKYELKVVDIDSSWFKSATNQKGLLKDLNDEYEKNEKANIIPWGKFLMQLTSNGLIGQDNYVYATGTSFSKQNTELRIKGHFGSHINIQGAKKDAKKVDIISGGIVKFNFNARDKFVNLYPRYFAFQTRNDIMVLPVNSKGFIAKPILLTNYQLVTGNSTHLSLLVNYETFDFDFKFKEMPYFEIIKHTQKVSVVRQQASLLDGIRITNYDRNQMSWKQIVVKKIWNDSHKASGTEEITLTASKNYKPDIIRAYYACDGSLETIPEETKPHSENQNDSDDSGSEELRSQMISDKTGNKIVARFAPYSAVEEEASYFGFENYEENGKWTFNTVDVISNICLTGKKCLELKNGNVLNATFNPRHQEGVYIASSWLKMERRISIKEPLAEFKALINIGEFNMTLQGTVQKIVHDWCYSEIYLNFEVLRGLYSSFTFNQIKQHPPFDEVKAIFKIILMPSDNNQSLIIDHVTFSPVDLDFEASIFNEISGALTSTIKRNGEIEHLVLDKFKEQVAAYNENFELEWFSAQHFTNSEPDSKKVKIEVSFESGLFVDLSQKVLPDFSIEFPEQFTVSENRLVHDSNNSGSIFFPEQTEMNSSGFRLQFHLLDGGELQLSLSSDEITISLLSTTNAQVILNNVLKTTTSPFGELIFLKEGKRCIVFIEGKNIFDQHTLSMQSTSKVFLSIKGLVHISNIMKFHNLGVNIEFMNEIGENRQVSKLASEITVMTIANIFDSKGRPAITTKLTEMTFTGLSKLLIYRPDFVSGQDQVWTTGILGGLVASENEADEGFPYSRTLFKCSPLNVETGIGQPGRNFSVQGKFHKEKNFMVSLPVLENMFPKIQGFHYEITKMPNDSILVFVYDIKKNKVAKYVAVAGFDNRLSTYHYDDENNLIKVLSPNYYRTKIMQSSQKSSHSKAKGEISDGVEFKYDKTGRVTEKISPDSGSIQFIYDNSNRKAYEKIYDQNRQTTSVLYYKYDAKGNLMQTGHLLGTGFKNESRSDLDILYKKNQFQFFSFNDEDTVAFKRNRQKTIKTVFDWKKEDEISLKKWQSPAYQGNVVEKYLFSRKGEIISKKLVIADNDFSTIHSYMLNRTLINNSGKTRNLAYPLTSEKFFNLHHTYDKMGNLIGLGVKTNPFEFVRFDYNSNGNLVHEQHLKSASSNLTRTYSYNSPGYLTKISDPYLDESLEYTRNGYGQDGFGDGIVMEATFIPKWQKQCNPNWLILNEQDKQSITEICEKALQNIGVLSSYSKVLRIFSKEDELLLPSTCTGSIQFFIKKLICSKIKPKRYSYRFRYGDHQELISAKYISEDVKIGLPLTFTELQKTTGSNAELVWDSLIKAKYIAVDNRYFDSAKAVAQVFGEFSNLTDMPDAFRFKERLIKLMELTYFKNATLSLENVKDKFLVWSGCRENECSSHVNFVLNGEASNVYKKLSANNLISDTFISSKFLDTSFRRTFNATNHTNFQTLKMLYEHREYGILSHPYDFEAFDSDANGNHKKFYNGFKRYTLEYENGTNKIKQVMISDATMSGIPEESFAINHDERGNVVKAMHKNIERIHYHPVSQRTTQIDLLDGRYLRFVYDAAGERILKLVYNAQHLILSRTFYVRDEKSRVLVDVKTVYSYNPMIATKKETLYLYGPRGLVGMIRDGAFYSVITDHVGSVRLVVTEGQVVAQFDYFPYGELQRSHKSNCVMDYLYTGKEFDEETGLYNFHARLYDPSIGRFYQADPQAQYFNPYLYAGNSPVSLIDPDGEFAFILAAAIGCSIAGAYFGGAAVSSEWDPTKWNWKSPELWVGLVGGAIGGAMVPFTLPAAFAGLGAKGAIALFAFGLTVAYVNTAAANSNWNPAKWDWSSPVTINGILTGFTSGISLVGGVKVLHLKGVPFAASMFSIKFQVAAKVALLGVSYTVGVAVAYGHVASAQRNAAFWKWDFSSPSVYAGLMDGFDSGLGWPQNIMESVKGISKLSKNAFKFAASHKNLKSMLKNTKGLKQLFSSPLFKTVSTIAMGALMVSSANSFYQDGWNNEFATYESLINGMFFGKDIKNLKITYDSIKMKSKLKKLNIQYDRYFASKNYQLSDEDFKVALTNRILDITEFQNAPTKNLLQETLDDFLSGKIRMIDVIATLRSNGLDPIFTRKLIILDSDIDETRARKKEFYPEEELPFMTCGGKRRRRSIGKSQLNLNIIEEVNPHLNSRSGLLLRENVNSFKSKGTRVVQDVWCRHSDTGDSFWCFQDKLNILVSPLRGDCSLGPQKAAPPLLGDSYSHCHPVNDGVYCQGERTSILVTQSPHVNALEVLTAQAMLLRVAVHAAGKMWKSLRSLFATAPSHERFKLTDTTLCRWNESLRSLEQMQIGSGQNWARVEIDDCKQIIDNIGMSAAQQDVDFLEERLEALAVDLAECLDDYAPHSSHQMYSTSHKHVIGYPTVNESSIHKIINSFHDLLK